MQELYNSNFEECDICGNCQGSGNCCSGYKCKYNAIAFSTEFFYNLCNRKTRAPNTLEITWPQHSRNNIINCVDVNQTISYCCTAWGLLGSIISWEINFHRHDFLCGLPACGDRHQCLASPSWSGPACAVRVWAMADFLHPTIILPDSLSPSHPSLIYFIYHTYCCTSYLYRICTVVSLYCIVFITV